MFEPFEMLHTCHERVQRTLDLLQRLQQHLLERGCDTNARQAAKDVLRYFDLAAPLHHQDEELHVFPPLLAGADKAARALVERLIQDHRRMEGLWAQARVVLQTMVDDGQIAPLPGTRTPLTPAHTALFNRFATLYAQHMQDEEGIAYPAAQAQLTADARQSMQADMMQRRGVRSNQKAN
jgi:iron-sulfur cluster repair protein YtfE (RIC family)